MSKKLSTVGLALGVLGLCALCGFSTRVRAEGSESGAKPLTCVESSSEAHFNTYAYDHLVTLHNACDKAATCTVTTDVNPDPITVELSPDESKTVRTFTASPSRIFHASVSCKVSS